MLCRLSPYARLTPVARFRSVLGSLRCNPLKQRKNAPLALTADGIGTPPAYSLVEAHFRAHLHGALTQCFSYFPSSSLSPLRS